MQVNVKEWRGGMMHTLHRCARRDAWQEGMQDNNGGRTGGKQDNNGGRTGGTRRTIRRKDRREAGQEKSKNADDNRDLEARRDAKQGGCMTGRIQERKDY